MIKPTVGRVVHYTPHPGDSEIVRSQSGKLAALIVEVWSDQYVNLCVFQANGTTIAKTSVLLLQADNDPEAYANYDFCEWMPYQKGQAAKTEELEKELKNADGIEQSAYSGGNGHFDPGSNVYL